MRAPLLALIAVATTAHAFDLKRDSTGAPVGWKSPLHFVVDSELAAHVDVDDAADAFQAAMASAGATVPELSIDAVRGKVHTPGYDFDHPEQSGSEVLVPDEWKWDADAVAITVLSVSISTHAILEADIALNAHHTAFAVVKGEHGKDKYDLQNALTHELGHALGLAHSTHPEAVMYPHSAPGEISKRIFASDDLDGLQQLYPAGSAGTSPPVGCSAAGAMPFGLLALGTVLLRRRRLAIGLVVAIGVLGSVGQVLAAAPQQAGWRVETVRTLPPARGAAVLESELMLVRDGVRRSVRVAGGRWGDVEQIVEGLAVPGPGAWVR